MPSASWRAWRLDALRIVAALTVVASLARKKRYPKVDLVKRLLPRPPDSFHGAGFSCSGFLTCQPVLPHQVLVVGQLVANVVGHDDADRLADCHLVPSALRDGCDDLVAVNGRTGREVRVHVFEDAFASESELGHG